MPRPKTKSQLLAAAKTNLDRLMQVVRENDTLEDMVFPDTYLNRNTSDVFCHLYHWHLMMKKWYDEGMTGKKPAIPAPGYTWKTVPELNKEIQKKYENTDLTTSIEKLISTHNEMMDIISRHSEVELFTKKLYNWTGSTSLGAYLISATSSHYDWAYKLIKKCIQQFNRSDS